MSVDSQYDHPCRFGTPTGLYVALATNKLVQREFSFPNFTPRAPEDTAAALPPHFCDEEATRACLFSVGVIILSLIFGHSIESCSFRRDYYGFNNRPNDQTEIYTARKWARGVLGRWGVDISDVVRQCLDCSFDPRPDFSDKTFWDAVYKGVVKPLASYSKMWSSPSAKACVCSRC